MNYSEHMYLIYPGMSDFEEVEIQEPASDPGFVFVRPLGSDDPMKVHMDRLVDYATAMERKSTKLIERDGYTVSETTVVIK